MKRHKHLIILIGAVIVAFALGYVLKDGGTEPAATRSEIHEHSEKGTADSEKKNQIWTCSMHPQIRKTEPGTCPLCGMDLIPAAGDEEEVGMRELKLSPTAIKLAEIQTTAVERKYVEAEINMVGKVDYDETNLSYITAWIPGRLDRLYVDYTGVPVKKGDHLVSIYSPELLTAQEELLQAIKTANEMKKSNLDIMIETADLTVEATREKLRLWGLNKEQINAIEKSGKTSDHITIYAPIGGIVVHKNAVEGMYVNTGERIYTIADLSHLWLKLDAYESDLMWIRYGQPVEIETKSYPGQIFKGVVSFIDPVLNDKSRTVKVRVNVENTDGRLKPGMFISTTVHARVAEGGKVMDAALAGKWICPMHPEVVKESSGSCDKCGMPLTRAETLGYAVTGDGSSNGPPLVIPATAPLVTGKRAVVYVANPNKEGVFEMREIALGPRAGAYYLVDGGLEEGEKVVSYGNFKIDSALQLLAKPSMMSPEGGVAPTGHANHGGMKMPGMKMPGVEGSTKEVKKETAFETPENFRKQIDSVMATYFRIQQALSGDDSEGAKKEGINLLKTLEGVDMGLLKGPAHMAWMKELQDLNKNAKALADTADIVKQREAFYSLSASLTSIVKRFGTGGKQAIHQFFCPMAFNNRGAHWLQSNEETKNPYFGASMLMCGDKTATLVPVKK